MDGTVQAQKATAPDQPAVCTEETCATSIAGDAGQQALDAQAPTADVVEEASPTTGRGPGRPRTIPTGHRCCPNEECPAYGRLGDDPLHDIVGCGTYTTTHGEVRQMYRCNVCGKPFSETAGPPLLWSQDADEDGLHCFAGAGRRLGIRAVARIHGVEPDTVLDWLKKAGRHCRMLSEYMMQELNVTQVQMDELWTFVRKKERMLKEWEKLHSEWGDTWVWVAFDPVHKLVIAVLVGERTEEEAVGFVARLRARLADACQPLLTSDSLPCQIHSDVDTFPKARYTLARFMRFKRLELQGYKSFASRTEFLFPTGITAIVGPNGSGKSNIADAIRWALGEQSLRMLRGKSTADMIFSGSRRRARAGMAEVLLTLDNEDGWLPVEFTEVTIGRRAYRSGESEYLLNGSRVRLRDLTELLAESGLSQRTYTVVGQGLVDAALSLRPQERRALFEEAAGIAVYRARREGAVARLEEAGRNLERVHDILGEIAPRLKRLEAQAARFQQYERVSAHLKRLQRAWYGYHWGQAQEALRAAQERARSLEDSLVARQAEAETIDARLADLHQRQTELRGRLRDTYHRTADLHDQADAVQRELAALTERVRLLAVQREEALEELEPLLVQQEAQSRRVEAGQAQIEELRTQVVAREARVAALEKELEGLRRQAQKRAGHRVQVLRELEALRARLEELEAAVAEARAAEVRLEAEKELLARMREKATGFARGTRSLLEAVLPGVEGLLSGLIQVQREWERAVEAALGPLVQGLVVRDWGVVAVAQGMLDADERAALIPLADLRAQPWKPPEGQLRAADAVTCGTRLRPVVEALLGRTLLVEDLSAARTLLADLPSGCQCVTRAGEVVAANGTVTVGSGGGVLAQERAWRELPERLAAARRRREEMEAEATRAAQGLAALEAALEEANRQAVEASDRVTEAESGLLTQARTDLAVARQALEGQRTLLQREVAALERIKAQMAARKGRLEELAAQGATAEERLAELRDQAARFEQELARLRARIGPAEEALSRLAKEQEQIEAQERRARARVRQMEERVSNARLEVARCQDRLAGLQHRIQEELGLVELEVADQVTAQSPLPLRPLVSPLPVVEVLPEGLEEEIQRLKARLRQLGPVNPNAPQEYAETQERYQFLSTQVTDLEAASARLREVIADLDRMMEQAFRETFTAVAAAFGEIFTRLFNGGSARLELTDPGDLAHTGVDIVAQPPGKRTQSLALLSGGERALTAVALIFSILRVRPTPFCVLDEVDAMLDEANIARFRAVLEELSRETQFIIITHNRGTVEAADTVYGVSMGSEGISQVVSLQLEGQEMQTE